MPSLPTSTTTVNNALLSSTLQARQSGYVDIVSRQNPLWYWLRQKNQYKPQNGGARIEWAIEYGQDTTEPSFQGYDLLPIQPQDNVTIATAAWKEYFKRIVISGMEKRINSGEGKIFSLLGQKEKNALNSLQQQFNVDCYGTGLGNSGKKITGLDAICPTANTTGTLFGVNRATITAWQNQVVKQQDISGSASYIAYLTQTTTGNTPIPLMRSAMDYLWMLCGRLKVGGPQLRHPDLILSTEAYYRYYSSMQYAQTRYTNTDMVNVGYDNLMFNTATMIPDQDCPNDSDGYAQAYFLNSGFLNLYYHPQANLTITEMIESDQQDAFSSKILWMGELICTNVAKQGKHYQVTDRSYTAA